VDREALSASQFWLPRFAVASPPFSTQTDGSLDLGASTIKVRELTLDHDYLLAIRSRPSVHPTTPAVNQKTLGYWSARRSR